MELTAIKRPGKGHRNAENEKLACVSEAELRREPAGQHENAPKDMWWKDIKTWLSLGACKRKEQFGWETSGEHVRETDWKVSFQAGASWQVTCMGRRPSQVKEIEGHELGLTNHSRPRHKLKKISHMLREVRGKMGVKMGTAADQAGLGMHALGDQGKQLAIMLMPSKARPA